MHTRWSPRRPGDVVQEAEAGVVGVVDVVDGEQEAVRRRRQADEFGRGDEQLLVGALAGPRDLRSGERPIDLVAVMIGEAVEQRRMTPAHIGERLHDRRVRPRPLDRCRRAVTDPEVQLLRPRRDRGEQRRLPDSGGTADEQRAAAPRRGVEQRTLGDRQLAVAADHRLVASRHDVVLGEQPVTERQRFASGNHTQLASQRAVHAFELAQGGVAIAVRRVATHECEMGELVARVELDHRLPLTVEAQQVEMAEPQLLAALLGPRLVAVLRQQLAAVHRERLAGRVPVLVDEGAAGEILELHDVDGRVGVGEEDDVVTAQHQ